MIDKILERFGYYKPGVVRNLEENPFTVDEILNLYVGAVNTLEDTFSEVEEKKLMAQLKGVDGFLEWIDVVVARDIKNHFSAVTDDQRAYIRGMQKRILDIKRRCVVSDTPIKTRITGVRYG